ncbi:hypothetical protein G5V58_12225 [Nocardioides anomalus]|uniref:A9CJY8-like N-terminal domain-containing protein n=1 Tax=Nocardioides anomalus TaxID=2712223 RepID=A0A6G6WDM5_9ACTN|nr:hypothetical protein [Nocardioides anomalus]QIG43428.1 hypothetical protein G5V58_12225 [Nocardioides anomalus]
MSIEKYPETLAVVRLGPGAEVPGWAESSSVFAILATATETTLVCAARSVPTKSRHERPFTAYRVERGTPVPEGARVLSAFDRDWVLVPGADVERAEEEWRRSGQSVEPAVPTTPGEKQK